MITADQLKRDVDQGEIRRVLLVAGGRVGDTLMETSVAESLKRNQPDMELTVLASIPDLWQGHPQVDRVLSLPAMGWRGRGEQKRIRVEFAAAPPDALMIFDRKGPVHAFAKTLGARYFLDHPVLRRLMPLCIFPSDYNAEGDGHHTLELHNTWAQLLGAAPPPWRMCFTIPDEFRRRAKELLAGLGVPPGGRLVLYNVGTHQNTTLFARRVDRVWPIENFVDCAKVLINKLDSPPVFFLLNQCSRMQYQQAKQAARALGTGKVFITPDGVNLQELGALLLACSCVLTGNTGPMHMAAALDVPTVAVFDHRWPPSAIGPFMSSEKYRVLTPPGEDIAGITGASAAQAVLELLATG